MQLKEFIEMTIENVVKATEDVSKKLDREIYIAKPSDNKSIEFDIAITTEKTGNNEAGIAVLGGILGGKVGSEIKNGEINRIKFGIYVNSANNKQLKENREEITRLQQGDCHDKP